jgi:hypothetical protein
VSVGENRYRVAVVSKVGSSSLELKEFGAVFQWRDIKMHNLYFMGTNGNITGGE